MAKKHPTREEIAQEVRKAGLEPDAVNVTTAEELSNNRDPESVTERIFTDRPALTFDLSKAKIGHPQIKNDKGQPLFNAKGEPLTDQDRVFISASRQADKWTGGDFASVILSPETLAEALAQAQGRYTHAGDQKRAKACADKLQAFAPLAVIDWGGWTETDPTLRDIKPEHITEHSLSGLVCRAFCLKNDNGQPEQTTSKSEKRTQTDNGAEFVQVTYYTYVKYAGIIKLGFMVAVR